ncbi:GNAT family N-acetyltransferase [Vagococcus carniphilus]|uniref:GNAT family N-acetyltransferase n=1 Tax=Vagococcus carniphilus TaxID=218144 RepID=A0AAW8U5H0_9ENTE|nr:GNAT family N-acetyltransferase [Vagococcus carniphilus]MDT2833512.1 GNAT family N-acetyltransferase [Vagococcus carniphilus]MDT2838131.1 GNAT family N-acetyltransferase [Vagococcus carniphilus]MDT2848646.1 GNAT family N-acetyltransferase [Vagococcus carniphilus]MDT2853708.1 GNAT family N-acetyltransferase [Vagococcus carniphilus]
MTIKHTEDIHTTIYEDALAIRKEVFVTEQQVPLSLEIEDEEVCVHFVLYEDNEPAATVRLFPKDKSTYKIQRMAVLKLHRQKGFGREIMIAAENYAKISGKTQTILGAQTHALAFYESMGYEAFGDEFLDAGIKHFNMKKEI